MLDTVNLNDLKQEVSAVKIDLDDSLFVPTKEMDNALSVVGSLDFTQMNNKLVSFYGWKEDQVLLMHDYYKKWLALHVCYPSLATAPSMRLDEYWHMHILDTEKYMADCQIVFGKYLHHYPYFGLDGDKTELDNAFEMTNKLFEKHFGHRLTGTVNPCSSTSCR